MVADNNNNEALILSLKELEVNDEGLMTNDGDVKGNTTGRQLACNKKAPNKNKRDKGNKVKLMVGRRKKICWLHVEAREFQEG